MAFPSSPDRRPACLCRCTRRQGCRCRLLPRWRRTLPYRGARGYGTKLVWNPANSPIVAQRLGTALSLAVQERWTNGDSGNYHAGPQPPSVPESPRLLDVADPIRISPSTEALRLVYVDIEWMILKDFCRQISAARPFRFGGELLLPLDDAKAAVRIASENYICG